MQVWRKAPKEIRSIRNNTNLIDLPVNASKLAVLFAIWLPGFAEGAVVPKLADDARALVLFCIAPALLRFRFFCLDFS